MHNDTWNILEFKLNLFFIDDGTVTFTYRKTSDTSSFITNGRFRFDSGFFTLLHDDDPTTTARQTATFEIKKGFNELIWYYAFATFLPTDGLFAEISVTNLNNIICRTLKSSQ